jgi:hypothetical protein
LCTTLAAAGIPAGIPRSFAVWVKTGYSHPCAEAPPSRASASFTQAAVRSSVVVVFGIQSAYAVIPIDFA